MEQVFIFDPEDGSVTFLRNIGIHLQDDMSQNKGAQPEKVRDEHPCHISFEHVELMTSRKLIWKKHDQSGVGGGSMYDCLQHKKYLGVTEDGARKSRGHVFRA